MGCWAIYQAGSGALFDLASSAPELTGLHAQGLGAAYFGEDKPDLSALRWCPKRLSFVAITDARELDELRGMVANLTTALSGVSERLDALSRGVNALADDVAEARACTDELARSATERFAAAQDHVDRVDRAAGEKLGRVFGQIARHGERLSAGEEALAALTAPKPSFWSKLKG